MTDGGRPTGQPGQPVSAAWPWPESLDAVMSAPRHHTVLFENDRVRVLDTRIEPGDTVPVHAHRWPSVLYVLGWSDFVRRDHAGEVLLDTRRQPVPSKPPTVLWSGPLAPHSLENVGQEAIHIISVELKKDAGRPRAAGGGG